MTFTSSAISRFEGNTGRVKLDFNAKMRDEGRSQVEVTQSQALAASS
jgi:hypothetical protein